MKLLKCPFKILFLLSILIPTLTFALHFPPLTERIYDEAGLLDLSTRNMLISKLNDFENKTKIQIVIASFNSLQNQTVEDFSYQLVRYWQIGEKNK